MRVIGSQCISTRFGLVPVFARAGSTVVAMSVSLLSLPDLLVARFQLLAAMAPLGLLVDRPRRDAAESPDDAAIEPGGGRRHPRSGRLVHERHELVREPRHRAADADPADVRAAADAVQPAALGHVALDDRAPAAELDDAFGRAVLVGEVALLVVAGAVAPLVHRV